MADQSQVACIEPVTMNLFLLGPPSAGKTTFSHLLRDPTIRSSSPNTNVSHPHNVDAPTWEAILTILNGFFIGRWDRRIDFGDDDDLLELMEVVWNPVVLKKGAPVRFRAWDWPGGIHDYAYVPTTLPPQARLAGQGNPGGINTIATNGGSTAPSIPMPRLRFQNDWDTECLLDNLTDILFHTRHKHNVVLVCFDISSRTSFQNAAAYFPANNPKLKDFLQPWPGSGRGRIHFSWWLIGLKGDLREIYGDDGELVTKEEACLLAKQVGALGYLECSAFSSPDPYPPSSFPQTRIIFPEQTIISLRQIAEEARIQYSKRLADAPFIWPTLPVRWMPVPGSWMQRGKRFWNSRRQRQRVLGAKRWWWFW